eukprot:8257713-Pyramimonas_sp.AAC.1
MAIYGLRAMEPIRLWVQGHETCRPRGLWVIEPSSSRLEGRLRAVLGPSWGVLGRLYIRGPSWALWSRHCVLTMGRAQEGAWGALGPS